MLSFFVPYVLVSLWLQTSSDALPPWVTVLLGPVGLLVGTLIAIYGNVRGWWWSGTAHAAALKACADQLSARDAQIEQERTYFAASVSRLQSEKDAYWTLLQRYLVLLQTSATAADKGATLAVTLASHQSSGATGEKGMDTP